MTPLFLRKRATQSVVILSILVSGYACSSDSTGGGAGKSGSGCDKSADCKSGVCTEGQCVGNGDGAPSNAVCTSNDECASNSCVNQLCTAGHNLEVGKSCAASSECKSGICKSGVCTDKNTAASGGSGNGGTAGALGSGYGEITATNPPFKGLGNSWRPLTTGCGPDTAKLCTGGCETSPDSTASVIRPPALLCFDAKADGPADPTPDTPAAIIEQVIETLNGQSYVHIRVTFDPAFADNTYGANASAGWFATNNGKTGKGHTFEDDLTKSDHIDLMLTDGTAKTVMTFGEDYITNLSDTDAPKPGGPGGPGKPGATATGGTSGTGGTTSSGTSTTASGCGFASLGVLGGDGDITLGNSSDILAVATSIERNVSGCGYCSSSACSAGTTGTGDGDCTVNSPVTDENYTPNAETPNWNYNVVYEVWVSLSAFGDAGFGQAYITYVHASPSKLEDNTLYVEPSPCPPGWGACPPGQNCSFAPPTGSGGAGGNGGGSGSGGCGPNEQLYNVGSESVSICTPIPYAGYPGMAACPSGWQIDVGSEGRYCIPL